jgi:hypothetical protein
MKKNILIVIVLMTLIGYAVGHYVWQQYIQERYIAGRVIEKSTEEPVSGVTVNFRQIETSFFKFDWSKTHKFSTVTGTNGTFRASLPVWAEVSTFLFYQDKEAVYEYVTQSSSPNTEIDISLTRKGHNASYFDALDRWRCDANGFFWNVPEGECYENSP